MVFAAWVKLQWAVPSEFLPLWWRHGEERFLAIEGQGALKAQAWLLALVLPRLVDPAPPDELIAISRDAAP